MFKIALKDKGNFTFQSIEIPFKKMLLMDQQLEWKAERSTLFELSKLGFFFFLTINLKNVQPHNNFNRVFGGF